MAEFDVGHPFGQQVESIHTSLQLGFLTVGKVTEMSPQLKVYYEDPLTVHSGVATIRVADWETENHSAIYVPLVVDPTDTTWQVECEHGRLPVRQRVITKDFLGRCIPVKLDGREVSSPYVQVDVVDEGLVFSVKDGQKITIAYGEYEGQTYDRVSRFMGWMSGVTKLSRLVGIA